MIDSLTTLQTSVIANVASRIIERRLMEHEQHYRQWRGNEQLARQMGY